MEEEKEKEIENIEYLSKNKQTKSNKTLLFLLFIILAFGAGLAVMYLLNLGNTKVITKNRTISTVKVSETSMEDAIDKVYDAVLCIEVLDSSGTAVSTGTGFVYDKDGYVLTNAHVITDGSSIRGTLSNGNKVTLKLLGFDSYSDIAVLKMDAKNVLKVASIGTSKNIKIGNTVFTVGSPMGVNYAGTVTKGILSGKDRLIETSSSSTNTYESYIVKVLQTDAAISPGSSGGPLVDLNGDVIGITSLKLVDSSIEGMGFAIPIEDVMTYVDTLEQGGKIERPIIGVNTVDLTNKNYLYRYGINIDTNLDTGVVIVKVLDGYPAANAGLKQGDIITKVGDTEVKTTAELKYALYKHKVGDTIEITYYRNDKKATIKVTLSKSE